MYFKWVNCNFQKYNFWKEFMEWKKQFSGRRNIMFCFKSEKPHTCFLEYRIPGITSDPRSRLNFADHAESYPVYCDLLKRTQLDGLTFSLFCMPSNQC